MSTLKQAISGLTQEELFFVLLATFFFSVALLFVAFIFVSRVVKSIRQRKMDLLQTNFQSAINVFLFDADDKAPETAYAFNLAELRKQLGSSLARQVLVNQLINMRKNLSGASARTLEKLYVDLNIHQFSINKLKSSWWYVQAEGIRELAEMNYSDARPMLKPMLKSRNKTLKEEIFMASIRLEKENPLSFLNDYDSEITPWMRINIHHHLALMDARSLPGFSQWFNHSRDDVVLFVVSMARHFRQATTVPALIKLLKHNSHVIVASAVRALGELEAFDAAEKIIELKELYWSNSKVSNCVVRYLGRVGHSKTHVAVLEEYLAHPNYLVRLESVRALNQLGDESKKRLTQTNQQQAGKLDRLIEHANEPLLQ